jgi:hypothetical protein
MSVKLPQDDPSERLPPVVENREESFDSADFSYTWLKDENLLRDEGVYFGLTTESPDSKLNTIDHYFEELIARLEQSINNVEEEKARIDHLISTTRQERSSLQKELERISTEYHLSPNPFWRNAFSIGVYSLVVVLNFWLVFELFGDKWVNSIPVTVGIYLLGLLVSFGKKPWILYRKNPEATESDEAEVWKSVLEELGVPLAVALFILFWSFENLSAWESVSLFIILLILFLYAGKGLMAYIQEIPQAYKTLLENRQKNEFRKERIIEVKELIRSLQTKINAEEEGLKNILQERYSQSMELKFLRKKKETMKAYFLSEFHLAKESRSSFVEFLGRN